ncbi:MAG: hypothetical protein ACOZNI_12990 [Myxococcota bacterium]
MSAGPLLNLPANLRESAALADDDARGVVLHANGSHWRVRGRDASGRHYAHPCDVNGRDLDTILVPVLRGIPAWERRLARTLPSVAASGDGHRRETGTNQEK